MDKPSDASLPVQSEADSPQPGAEPSTNWRTFAAVAAVVLMGWPFISTGTVYAMWAEISRLLTFRGRS